MLARKVAVPLCGFADKKDDANVLPISAGRGVRGVGTSLPYVMLCL